MRCPRSQPVDALFLEDFGQLRGNTARSCGPPLRSNPSFIRHRRILLSSLTTEGESHAGKTNKKQRAQALHMLPKTFSSMHDMHGIRLEQISHGVFQVNAGSLFPALGRLVRDGLITGEWRVTQNNRRAKYYTVTALGRAKLKRETRDWQVQTTAIARILQASLGEL